jgi:peptidoglycan/xylan/chitin deacetylase (PgdA/CDA1 family)
MISITFDDGWKNQYSRGLPILDKYGIKGTFYIISRMPEFMLHEGEGRMVQSDIVELAEKGHEIGAHSQTHPHLQLSWPSKVKKEVRGSKKDLEDRGFNIKTFCYPYGRRNWYVDRVVANSGFSGARLAHGGYNTNETNRFGLEAKCLRDFTSFEEVKNWIDDINNRWLILVFHQIEENPPGWGTTPGLLEDICKYIKENNLESVTISEGIEKMK